MNEDVEKCSNLFKNTNACRLPPKSFTAYAIQPWKPSKDVYKPKPDIYTFVCVIMVVLLVGFILLSGGLPSLIYNGTLLLVMLLGLMLFQVLRSSSLRRR